MYNILSLVLGITALIFAVHSLQVRGCLICCTVSGICSGLSLLLQLLAVDQLAQLQDVSAIYDTIQARVLAGALLLVFCAALNLLALLRGRNKECGTC